jgi:threonine dehydratase
MTFADIESARSVIARHFKPSRLLPAKSMPDVHLKIESDLPTGSFKPRGALVALYARLGRSPVREVIASSTGNHGAAVAYAARELGLPARIFLPANSNPVKRARIANLGASIVETADDLTEAGSQAAAYAATDRDIYYLDDASDPTVQAGPGTIAIEILEQCPEVTAIYVPVGDTALIRGIAFAAKHLRPTIRIIGVQAERAPSYYLSWTRGVPTPTDTCDTIADGLATRTPLPANVDAIRTLVDEMRLVTESQLLGAIRHLLLEEYIVAEPAGAAATAALLAESQAHSAPIALLVTGANITEPVLSAALSKS